MSLITRHVVKALIKAEDTGRYFIIRSTIPIMSGWSLVGGGVAKNEGDEQGLIREIQEELHIERSAFSNITKRQNALTSHHWILGIPVSMTTHVFDLTVPIEKDFEPTSNWEISESRWCDKKQMMTLLGNHYRSLVYVR